MRALMMCGCLGVGLIAQDMTALNDALNFHSLFAHSPKVGDLKEYRFDHGIWLNAEYIKQRTQSDTNIIPSAVQNLLVQGGYDYAFRVKYGQDFLGFGIEYGHAWVNSDLYQGSINGLALSLYNTFTHRSSFYIHTSLRYFASLQSLHRNFFTQMMLANLELGYTTKFARYFYFRPFIGVSGGYVPSFLSLGSHTPVFLKTGGYLGVNFNGDVRGDVHLGSYFDSDFFFASQNELEDYRFVFVFGTNLHTSKNFRLSLDVKSSLFGRTNIELGVSLGMRFLFGTDYSTIKVPSMNARSLNDVRKEMLHQSELARQRVQAKYHLKPQEVQSRYKTQESRDPSFVKEETRYANRQRAIREGATWIDITDNEQNYANRNSSSVRQSDAMIMKRNYENELARKYGK